MTAVDVVIVTHNTCAMTLNCARSALAEASDEVPVSVTVVDNASLDETVETLSQEPGVEVVSNSANEAYGRACNQGAAVGSAPLLLILNSDIMVKPGALRKLAKFMGESPAHVVAGGRLVDPGTDSVQVGHAARAFPTLWTQAAQMVGLERKWPSNLVSRRALGFDIDYDKTQDVDQPPGSCLMVRREDFEAIGGFDEGFFYWYEDVDICRRLRKRGRIAYVHDAPFEHEGGATFASWGDAARAESWYAGIFRYFSKHHPKRERFAIRSLVVVLAGLRAVSWLPRDRHRARVFVAIAKRALSPGERQ